MTLSRRSFLKGAVATVAAGLGIDALVSDSVAMAKEDLETLAIFYGWPTAPNGSRSVRDAIRQYENFNNVIFGARIEVKDHPGKGTHPLLDDHGAHDDTIKIIEGLKNTNTYGYVNLGNRKLYPHIDDHSLEELTWRIDSWAKMGVKGIFFDECSLSYMPSSIQKLSADDKRALSEIYGNKLPQTLSLEDKKAIFKDRYNHVVKECDKRNLRIFINSDDPRLIMEMEGLKDDEVLLEPFEYSKGKTQQPYNIWHDNPYEKWAKERRVRVFGVATYDPSMNTKQINQLVINTRNRARELKITGYAVTDPIYGASGPHTNKVLITKPTK